jgi:hypothetical protein
VHHLAGRRSVLILSLAAGIAGVALGCTERQPVTGAGPLPVAATAFPSPDGRNVPVAKDPPQDVQELSIEIIDGRFAADRYSMQVGPARLRVTTRGGPYRLEGDRLLQPQELPPNATTTIGVTAPDPGDYIMRLASTGRATAVLNVRPPGAR